MSTCGLSFRVERKLRRSGGQTSAVRFVSSTCVFEKVAAVGRAMTRRRRHCSYTCALKRRQAAPDVPGPLDTDRLRGARRRFTTCETGNGSPTSLRTPRNLRVSCMTPRKESTQVLEEDDVASFPAEPGGPRSAQADPREDKRPVPQPLRKPASLLRDPYLHLAVRAPLRATAVSKSSTSSS